QFHQQLNSSIACLDAKYLHHILHPAISEEEFSLQDNWQILDKIPEYHALDEMLNEAGLMFGDKQFASIIGDIHLHEKTKFQMLEDLSKEIKEMKRYKKEMEAAAARKESIDQLVLNLQCKLEIFTGSATGCNYQNVLKSWQEICAIEASSWHPIHLGGIIHSVKDKYQEWDNK
ncbi:hypothetical protein H0H87_002298, partial [Tephrocybe sp. NHM501043]